MKELRAKMAELHARLQSIHKNAEAENRSLNETETREWESVKGQIASLKERIARQEELDAEERSMAQVSVPAVRPLPETKAAEERTEWRNFGEFLQAVRFNPGDRRLQYQEFGTEKRVLQMGVGAQGGFLIPTQFRNTLLQIQPQDAIVRPRATVIPAGDPPDSAVTMPALDQSGVRGVYSGVTVNWIGEGVAKPETEPRFQEVTLSPLEVAAHTIITDKLLRNSDAASSIVSTLLRRAILAAEDVGFLRGAGAGVPRGILGHPATIVAARAVANQIAYNDVIGMYSSVLFGGPLVWIANQTTLPQLMTMVDAAGNLIWQPNAREGAPGTLLGIPVLLNERSPSLGTEGDLILADLSYYLIKDGSGIFVDASPHLRFLQNQTVIKAFWNVDGQPWLTTPLLQEDGVTQVSPFVALGA